MISISISIICLVYTIMLTIIYFSKKRINYIENKIFAWLLIVSLIGVTLDPLSGLLWIYGVDINSFFYLLLTKLIILFYITWDTLMMLYVILIADSNKNKNVKKYLKIFKIIYLGLVLLTLLLPVKITVNDNLASPTGACVNLVYLVTFVFLIIIIYKMIKNYKNLKNKKYLPLFVYLGLGMIVLLIQNLTGYLLMTAADVLITFLMYFTIENPDVQIINTLLRNKELVEQTVNDKSNFLFKISQEMKKPIKNIVKSSKQYNDKFSKEETKYLLSKIENEANSAYFIINDITDVTSMDVKKFKMSDNKYKTEKLLLDIKSNITNQLSIAKKSEKIKFKMNINNKYPDYLYGDNIKLKQIILSLVNNSIKYTKEGFIDIDLDIVTRYDACRMIFTIKDSGCGMDLYTINQLLSSNEELSVEEFNKIDSLDLKIPVIIKILKLLGGSISIKSEEGKGTTVAIVIDQLIDFDTTTEAFENIKKYNSGSKKSFKVLLADDSPDLDKIERILSKNNLDVITTLIGKDVIDKIENGDKYDLIILKDNLKPDTAYSILKKLQENKKFKTPVVIIIEKNQEFIKDHFIKDGFSDVIIRENIDNDLPKVISKYI